MSIEHLNSQPATVGPMTVRRAIPQRGRRLIGAWCFADHMGPLAVSPTSALDVAPHPHLGLATVTWLLDGVMLHRDSLGSEQVLRPGEVNLMTAARGVAHSEEAVDDFAGLMEGIQLWLALPDTTRLGPGAFDHLRDVPEIVETQMRAKVFMGEWLGAASPLRRDADVVGAQLQFRGRADLELDPRYEYGFIVLRGRVRCESDLFEVGSTIYVATGATHVVIETADDATLIVLGGVPISQPIFMWWNYVGTSREEVETANDEWVNDTGRFGTVKSQLPRLLAPPPWWRQS